MVKEFSKIPAAALSDCLGRNVGGLGLRPFHGNAPMLGSALTVIVKPSDNLMNQVTDFKQWRFSDQTLHES
jgi:regulator of RNase E activity RraA